MGREKQPLKREYKGDVIININDIFRNPDIQDEVIKELKKVSNNKNKKNGHKRD